MAKLAVVRVRGVTGIKKPINKALDLLNLKKVNYCTVIEDTPENRGVLFKVKDYVTWGVVDDATLKELISKRGQPNPKKPDHTKPFFKMNPPKKGYGRAGIKQAFKVGGGVGERKEKINDLLKRMF